jgi:hypothetical protein
MNSADPIQQDDKWLCAFCKKPFSYKFEAEKCTHDAMPIETCNVCGKSLAGWEYYRKGSFKMCKPCHDSLEIKGEDLHKSTKRKWKR